MRSSHEWNFAARLVSRLGENSALIDAATGRAFSAQQIADSIAAFASELISAGLAPGDRLLVSCGVNPASALAYLGAMYAGIVPVLADERQLAASGEQLFVKAHAKAAWTSGRSRWDWAQRNGFPQFEGLFQTGSQNSIPPFFCTEADLAALMPTSGSTGVPRLVVVSHGNLIANTEAIIRSQNLGHDERAMLIMPLSYCFGASVMHTHLYQGGTVVFDSQFMFPDKVLQAINAYSCTTFAGVPTVYNILLRRSNLDSIAMPTLRRFLQAGGALEVEKIDQLRRLAPQTAFLTMYGQTEATARISCLPLDAADQKLGSAGRPLDNLTLRIVDDRGGELSRGETGEILVSGPSICARYLDEPEATERKFDRGWLKTGDLGCIDEDGFLWIKGRISDFIKMRGYRVSLAEVEARVATIPGVGECAAAGVQHPEAGEALALFIVPSRGESSGQQLVEKIRLALPSQWTCASVRIVDELPKTANGKIARSQLQNHA